MIQGIDISHNNDPINWDNLSPNIQFVFCKATQGAVFKDPMFNTYWQELKAKNILHGAYHFLTATDSAQDQANNFLSRGVDFSLPGCLPPMLDVEDQVPASLNANITANKPAFIQLIADWLNIVQTQTGRTPIIYSYKNFFIEYLNSTTQFGSYPLWLASYQATPPGLPPGWTDWTIWQNSESGTIEGALTGGSFDMDLFNGTLEELQAL